MKYIFISYLNRSGSTFLVNQLSKSKDICVCPESEFLVSCLLNNPLQKFTPYNKKRIIKILLSEKKFSHWGISNNHLEKLVSVSEKKLECFLKILEHYKNKTKEKAKYIVFKHNNLLGNIGRITFNYSNIFHIAINRDPRGVFLSQKNTFSPISKKLMCKNPLHLAIQWNKFMKLIKSSNQELIQIEYAELIRNPIQIINLLAKQVGANISTGTLHTKTGDLLKFLPKEYLSIHKKAEKTAMIEEINKWRTELNETEKLLISTVCKKYLLKPENKKPGGINLSLLLVQVIPLFINHLKILFIQSLREFKLRVIC